MSELPALATSSRLAKIHSRIVEDGADKTSQDAYIMRRESKMLDVTITILSLTGFKATETRKRGSTAKVLEEMQSAESCKNTTAKMVASLENGAKSESSEGIPMTHIPSLSFQLPSPFSHKTSFDDIVSWPEKAAESFWPEKAKDFANMSSFEFQHKFVPEGGTCRLEPLVCPIQISVSRNGNMYKLGVASVFVNGEEQGESSIIVPVAIDERMSNGSKESLDEPDIPMVSLKGDTMKCSLDKNSSLRVLVKVSDPKSTDFTKPVSHFIEEPTLTSPSNECDPDQTVVEDEEVIPDDAVLSRDRSKDTSIRSALTDISSMLSSASLSQPYSTDEEDEDWSLSSASNSSITKLKHQLRLGGWLGITRSVDSSESLSLDDTTISSSSTTTIASSISEMKSRAGRWANRFACGAPLCGCRNDNEKDLLLSAVDENSILTEAYSLKLRE